MVASGIPTTALVGAVQNRIPSFGTESSMRTCGEMQKTQRRFDDLVGEFLSSGNARRSINRGSNESWRLGSAEHVLIEPVRQSPTIAKFGAILCELSGRVRSFEQFVSDDRSNGMVLRVRWPCYANRDGT